MKEQEIKSKVNIAKRRVLDMCIRAKKGHLTTAYSCAEIIAVLYYAVMRVDPQNPQWRERDRFVMSKNHGSLMTYPILADLGFFDVSELDTFMADGTRLGGHSKLCLSGVDFAGGSLGIGLGVAAGMAYAAKLDHESWLTFCLIGDAECYEGAIWEAAILAGHHKLNNLVGILDRNRLGITGFTEDLLRLEPFSSKWTAFGWDVKEIDGHNIPAIMDALSDIRSPERERPLMIIANTTKGHGIDFMSDQPLCHGEAPKANDIERAYAQLEVNRY